MAQDPSTTLANTSPSAILAKSSPSVLPGLDGAMCPRPSSSMIGTARRGAGCSGAIRSRQEILLHMAPQLNCHPFQCPCRRMEKPLSLLRLSTERRDVPRARSRSSSGRGKDPSLNYYNVILVLSLIVALASRDFIERSTASLLVCR